MEILVNKFMKKHKCLVVGKVIKTFPMGEWPGGLAEIKRLCYDDEFIAFFVKAIDKKKSKKIRRNRRF